MFGTRYVSVWFGRGRKLYTYKTRDRSITVNTVVYVPVGEDNAVKPAIVGGVYHLSPSFYPKDRMKTVIGKADARTGKAFEGVDMRRLTAAWNEADMPRPASPKPRRKKKEVHPYTIEEMMFYDDLFGD